FGAVQGVAARCDSGDRAGRGEGIAFKAYGSTSLLFVADDGVNKRAFLQRWGRSDAIAFEDERLGLLQTPGRVVMDGAEHFAGGNLVADLFVDHDSDGGID